MTDHLPCPCGKSSDAFSIYDNGWGTCFSGNCEKEKWSPRQMKEIGYDSECSSDSGPDTVQRGRRGQPRDISDDEGQPQAPIKTLLDRGLTKATLDRYGVKLFDDRCEWPIFTPEGEEHAVKTRFYPKKFKVDGSLKGAGLVGRQAFPPGSAKAITVTEGCEDAAAVFQMTGSLYPAVSVHGAGSALGDCRTDFEYLNSFDTVVLCFDNDEAGHKAAKKVAEGVPFPIGKLKTLFLHKGKDAGDYLDNGWDKDFHREWWKAESYRPEGLVFGKDLLDELLREDEYFNVEYPEAGLNAKTYGMRTSELVIVHAPPKIGKTSLIKKWEHHLLTNKAVIEKGYGVGILHFEEPKKDTGLGLLSIHNGVPYHLPDSPRPEKDIKDAFRVVLDNDRVIIYDHFGSNRVDVVLDKVRHMAAMGCKYIFIDHLSIIVSDQSGDERKQLDEILTKLKTMTMELDLCVIAVIHENREGTIRGTMAAEQLANIVISLEREKMDPDPWRANILKVSVEANRFCGRCGIACYLHYDEATSRLAELHEEAAAIYEAGGSDNEGGF